MKLNQIVNLTYLIIEPVQDSFWGGKILQEIKSHKQSRKVKFQGKIYSIKEDLNEDLIYFNDFSRLTVVKNLDEKNSAINLMLHGLHWRLSFLPAGESTKCSVIECDFDYSKYILGTKTLESNV